MVLTSLVKCLMGDERLFGIRFNVSSVSNANRFEEIAKAMGELVFTENAEMQPIFGPQVV